MGGTFDMDVYQRALAQQGMTPADFEKERRESMLAERLDNMERQSLIVSDADARAEYQRKNLKVGLQYVAIDKSRVYVESEQRSGRDQGYFNNNRQMFTDSREAEFRSDCGTLPRTTYWPRRFPERNLQKDYSRRDRQFPNAGARARAPHTDQDAR